jgi:hypothetical protein
MGAHFSLGVVVVAAFVGCGGAPAVPPPLGGGEAGGAESGGSMTSSSGAGGVASTGTSTSGSGSAASGTASSPSSGSSSAGTPIATGGFDVSAQMFDASSGDGLAGVSVCLLGSPTTCVSTASDGSFTLGGVQTTGSGFMGSMAGYVDTLWPVTPTGNVSGWSVNMRTTTRLTSLAEAVGATFGTMGGVYFQVSDGSGNSLSGVSAATTVGGKAAYFSGNGNGLDGTLSQTTTNGNGYVFGVGSGTVGLIFTAVGHVCTRSGAEGWAPAAAGQTMSVPVQSGKLTVAWVVCQ